MSPPVHRAITPRAPFDLVVVAGSYGSFVPLCMVLGSLPATFPVPIAVVRHLSARYPSYAAELIDRRCALTAKEATTGALPRPGAVYLAPPDRHLLVRPDGKLTLSAGPRVQFTRPAADPLFNSAARNYGRRVLAIVLSGMGRDGTQGVIAVKAAGGATIAQAPATCSAPSMPEAAIRGGAVDFILSPEGIQAALISLCMVPGAARFFAAPSLQVPASA